MMFTKILVPSDGSRSALETAIYAADLAKKHSASIVGVYLINTPKFIGIDDLSGTCIKTYEETVRHKARIALNELDCLCRDRNVEFNGYADESGQLKIAANNAVKTMGCDLIVIGSTRIEGIESLTHIWMTQNLLLSANVPVLVVKVGQKVDFES